MRYVKKPIPIEAIKWTGGNFEEIHKFMEHTSVVVTMNNELIISTLEGEMRASVGYYIVKGPRGEFYGCRGDIFEETYDKYEEPYFYKLYCPYCEKTIELYERPQIFYDAIHSSYKYRIVCPNCKQITEVDRL